MGHQNINFPGHMIDIGADQQGHNHLHPNPYNFYGRLPNFQPTNHSVVPASANQCNFNFHPTLERHESALFYGSRQYNSIQLQHPPLNIDLAVSSGHYNPYIPPSGISDFPVQVNCGLHDQLSPLTTLRVAGMPADNYFRNIHYMDDFRSFKRKNAEGAPSSLQYQNDSPGTRLTVSPMLSRPDDISPMDACFPPPEYGGNQPAENFENGSLRSVWNGSVLTRPEPVLTDNTSNLIQGNYVAPPVQLPRNPWFVHFGATNGNTGTFTWMQAPSLSYIHANVNRAFAEPTNMGVQSYRDITPAGFMYAPIAHAHVNPSHPTPPMPGFRGYSINGPSTISSSNVGSNPFPDVVDAGRPTFPAPVPPISFRLYQPQQQEVLLNSSARQQNLPHLRVLPEDEVAILEVPSTHESGDSIDLHREMRLDIDHMSYEELLALGEHIGSVGTGFNEEFIRSNLKTRTFTLIPACIDIEHSPSADQQKIDFCVVCQTEYEHEEKLGVLDCGHEYHRECIKKWLLVKNTCPICKSTALRNKAMGRICETGGTP